MERKIILLEARLRLVEQFVELRFCESFKDFSIRKMLRDLPPEDDNNDNNDHHESSSSENSQVLSKSKSTPPSYSTKKTRTSKRTSSPPKDKSTPANTRELRVRVIRVDGTHPSQNTTSSPPPSPSHPLTIKNPPHDSDDDIESNNDPVHNSTNSAAEDNPQDSDPDYSEDTSSPPKRKSAAGPLSSKKKRKSSTGPSRRIPRGNRKECPECHEFWKPEAFEKHLERHGLERKLKCRFCDKKFIQQRHVTEHERSHNLAKYGKMCRVKGCGQLCLDRSKQLVHERRCIRKRLGNGEEVDVEVLEDVRRRSQKIDLGWPQKEMEGTTSGNNEGIMEGVVEGGTEIVNNVDGDPLDGIGNF